MKSYFVFFMVLSQIVSFEAFSAQHCSDFVNAKPENAFIFIFEHPSEMTMVLRDEAVVAWKNKDFDPVYVDWLATAKRDFSHLRDEVELLRTLNSYTYDSFGRNIDWKGFIENPLSKLFYHHYTGEPYAKGNVAYANGKYRIGDLLRIKCGVCRHSSVALVGLLREFGFDKAYYVVGTVETFIDGARTQRARHAWVELELSDGRYLVLDPANGVVIEVTRTSEEVRVAEKGNAKGVFEVELGRTKNVEDSHGVLVTELNMDAGEKWNIFYRSHVRDVNKHRPIVNRLLRIR